MFPVLFNYNSEDKIKRVCRNVNCINIIILTFHCGQIYNFLRPTVAVLAFLAHILMYHIARQRRIIIMWNLNFFEGKRYSKNV